MARWELQASPMGASGVAGPPVNAPSYHLFEAAPVRPVALTPSGERLVVANIPDDRVEVFDVAPDGSLTHVRSVVVGMRPVAVAARTDREVWVVNHLSDSVSVVDLDLGTVTRTLLVGDEPRDIVFAGAGPGRAFVTTAHRGQHRTDASLTGVPGAGDPQWNTPGVGRADVWVFDAASPGPGVGGTPLRIVELFGDAPRALAVSPDGDTVYVAVHHSGNQTTTVHEDVVCDGFSPANTCNGDGITSPGGLNNGRLPGGLPGPSTNVDGDPAPETSLIVRFDQATGRWRDELGRNWNNGVRFDLPDLDVFPVDAATLAVGTPFAHVGTTLFNMAVSPTTGRVLVSNTEAHNEVRFEGSGTFGGTTVQGDLARSRLTVLDPVTGQVLTRHLNSHIDYAVTPAPAGVEAHSLSTPTDLVISADGATAYVAAFGSAKVGVVSVAQLEAGTFDPTVASSAYISVTGGGPGGLALDATGERLYVYTRFDNGVSVVDTTGGVEVDHLTLHSPEPAELVDGRPVLYDAVATSSNGEASCASCHIFGDVDHLAWDLGDPDAEVTTNPNAVRLGVFAGGGGINGSGIVSDLHPMKGPMTTQTLRGMATSGAMHWRGDRAVGFFGTSATDPRLSFKNFIVAFRGLLGDDVPETDPGRLDAMERFADFALALRLPPNPVRALDNSLTPAQQRGLDFYAGPRRSDGLSASNDVFGIQTGFTCDGCHRLDASSGFFGTDGVASFEAESQILKIPHLRNLYTKVGMFGMPDTDFIRSGDNGHKGPQIRGFGMSHDGSIDTLFRFLGANVFNNTGTVGFPSDDVRRDVVELLLAFDSDLAPVVGQQVTLSFANRADTLARVSLLARRCGTPFTSAVLGGVTTECDLVVHFRLGSRQIGLLFDPTIGRLLPDRSVWPAVSPALFLDTLRRSGATATFTAVPPGTGVRAALDRDEDGVYDGDELAAGTDPADPSSF